MIEINNLLEWTFCPFPEETQFHVTMYGKDAEEATWEIREQLYALVMGWA